jgi:hypothetical protein
MVWSIHHRHGYSVSSTLEQILGQWRMAITPEKRLSGMDLHVVLGESYGVAVARHFLTGTDELGFRRGDRTL